jgi:hypothetical protein
MSSAKEDCEALMADVIPFAEHMLNLYGEFLPFGSAMKADGEIVKIGATNGNEHPKSVDLIQIIKEGFRGGAKSGRFKATALVYDSLFTPELTGVKTDAIAISLNHREHYSVVVFLPYEIAEGNVVIGPASATKGDADIFFTKH